MADAGIRSRRDCLAGPCTWVPLVAVAEFARRSRRDLSPGDHFLAGRELGLFVLFLTLYATAYSGNSLLGYPGRAYRSGFSFISATGFMMAIIVMFHALAPKLRVIATRHRFITPGDWVRHRFGEERGGRALLACIGILMALAMVNFLLAQLKAMGHVTAGMSGDRIPYWAGVVGLAGMILFYETRGGMRAVAWTDAAQGRADGWGAGSFVGMADGRDRRYRDDDSGGGSDSARCGRGSGCVRQCKLVQHHCTVGAGKRHLSPSDSTHLWRRAAGVFCEMRSR